MTESVALDAKKLRFIVDKIHNLPTPPIVFAQITKVINDPDTSAYDIGMIISEDPALTAKVLKLTNSSYYGIPRKITNVKQAIVILGLEAVNSLVISASVFGTFSKNSKLDTEYLENFWRHSLSVGIMAKIISRLKESPSLLKAEMAFSAGLLHDIGKLIIISHLSEKHGEIKRLLMENRSLPEYDAENEILQFSHADIGAYLAGKWNLPESICETIMNHHNQDIVSIDQDTAIIHLANHLVHEMDIDEDKTPKNASPYYDIVWSTLDLDPASKPNMIDILRNEYGKAETFMKMAQGTA